jgi:hypothetical protein
VGVVEKETPPFSRACYPINLVRSCGSRWKSWRWVQLLLPAHSWERPFLTAFSPETSPLSRACYPINLVCSCGSRWKSWKRWFLLRPLGCPQMNWGRTLWKALKSNDLPIEFVKWREMAANRNQWRAICGSKPPSTTKETPTSSRQDIWAKLRNGTVPSWVQKLKRKFQIRKQKWTKSEVRPAGLKTRRSFSYTIITKHSCCWLCCCSLHNAKCIICD